MKGGKQYEKIEVLDKKMHALIYIEGNNQADSERRQMRELRVRKELRARREQNSILVQQECEQLRGLYHKEVSNRLNILENRLTKFKKLPRKQKKELKKFSRIYFVIDEFNNLPPVKYWNVPI